MLALDPFDPQIARNAERVACAASREPAATARLAPAALLLPTFFGPVAIAAPGAEDDARTDPQQ
jgi:hypothetical protein